MAYIVTDECINCMYQDCIEVCPVHCFYKGEDTIVINTDECIDCGVCEPECPVGAIKPDTIHNTEFWIELNQKYAEIWPSILVKGDPLPNADIWADNKNKFSLLSEKAAS